MGYLSILSSVLTILVKVWEQFFSDSATLARLKERQADIQGRITAESASLRRDYLRIEAQPDKTGQDLVDSLNKSVKP